MRDTCWKEVAYLLAQELVDQERANIKRHGGKPRATRGEETKATLDKFVGRWERGRCVYDDQQVR